MSWRSYPPTGATDWHENVARHVPASTFERCSQWPWRFMPVTTSPTPHQESIHLCSSYSSGCVGGTSAKPTAARGPWLGRACDKEKVQTRAGLPKSLHRCVLGIVVPGARMLHRRKLNHGYVGNVWSGGLKHFPRIGRARYIPSPVLRDQLVDYFSVGWAPGNVPDVVEPDRK